MKASSLYLRIYFVRFLINYLFVFTSALYIHSNEIHNVVALIKCLLVLRCQLYIFRTVTVHPQELLCTWGVQVLRYPIFFFSGMEADRNVKVVGGDVTVL